MAKKRKISRKRVEGALHWVRAASDQQLERYTNLITPSLQEAADAFNLDPDSEWHREILVRVLAHLMFGQGKRGRPPMTLKWAPPREYDLGMHFNELKREKPNIKYSQAAKLIKHRYRKEYADCSETTLRQRMPGAHGYYEWCLEEMEDHAAEQRRELEEEPDGL